VSSLQRVSGFSAQLMLEDHDTRTQSDLSESINQTITVWCHRIHYRVH